MQLKVFNTKSGILIEFENHHYILEQQDWDTFINDDDILKNTIAKLNEACMVLDTSIFLKNEVLAPVKSQEIWASGVTYYNSKLGREEESKEAGGSDFYARVYEAERPELFFKATANRTVGHKGTVRIRKDSIWNVPEPELTLVITSSGKIIGYTIGNDMSSRSIEGENPLYLPQAKTYDGCAALGPCILITDKSLSKSTRIRLEINRNGEKVFDKDIAIDQIKRKFEDIVHFLYRECTFPNGSLLMTGTGIVPSNEFTLTKGDEVRISIDGIGTLENTVG